MSSDVSDRHVYGITAAAILFGGHQFVSGYWNVILISAGTAHVEQELLIMCYRNLEAELNLMII